MEFTSRYNALNTEQKRAVDTIEGPVMVIAGPGTGKTELLSVRAANILQKTDTLPENILCLTFTESGQTAMRERLIGIIGKDAYKVAIHTFHSFGSEIIAQNREYFYNNALFKPADDITQYEILHAILEKLPFSNPLASTMNGEYTYLGDIKKAISELKRGSALSSTELHEVLAQNEASIAFIEKTLTPILEARISKTTADALRDSLELLNEHRAITKSLYEVTPLIQTFMSSLEQALEATISIHPTKPLSAWKSQWFVRDDAKNLVLKERGRLIKMMALATVYTDYLQACSEAGIYDYDDMIMHVVHALEAHDDLKYSLQEKYLYIMVDEFQDTNTAQMRILHALTDNPVNEDSPNILVVGDDDQAVYGFQGADISNVLNFSDEYPRRQLVVLTNNYRSGSTILAAARTVITQGSDRLENRIGELDKQLHATTAHQGDVTLVQAPTADAERETIVASIKQRLTDGADPSSIAVLARRHSDVQSLLPFFQHASVPVHYEKAENVLDSAPIVALNHAARVIIALADNDHATVEALLPELLAQPAWRDVYHITPQDIWRLSLDAYKNRQSWMEAMATTPLFAPIHAWLVQQALDSFNTQLEPLIDALVGVPRTADAAAADDDMPEASTEVYGSPYYRYFFSDTALKETPDAYLRYLDALRTIRAKLREYKPDTLLMLRDFVNFIELHRRLDSVIMSSQAALATNAPAVRLLTAHKSKGLEFETVYIVNAVDSAWGDSARGGNHSLAFPENMPLAPAGDTLDERLRLFYVAMTRAKQHLVISFADANDNNKATLPASFLLPVAAAQKGSSPTPTSTQLLRPAPHARAQEQTRAQAITVAEHAWFEPLVTPTTDLSQLLAPQLEKFKLSATSLNNFLDVSRGGPQHFLLNNLLRFPSAKTAPASYGSAIHQALQQAHTHLLATGEQKPLEDILHDFEVSLAQERLSLDDFTHYAQQGGEHLSRLLQSGAAPLTPSQKAEVNFAYQDVRVGDARITGALDVIDIDRPAKTVVVTDYKTGRPAREWGKGDTYTKLKLHKYRQQLLFYKLLVENSSEYSAYTATSGNLTFVEPTKSGESIVLSLDYALASDELERTRRLVESVWRHIQALDLPDVSDFSPDYTGVLAFEQKLIDEIE